MRPARPVRLAEDRPDAPLETGAPTDGDVLPALVSAASEAAGSRDRVTASLRLAEALGGSMPVPGRGSTLRLWEGLATIGSVDLTVARVVEPHLDACAILAEAGADCPSGATLGVYAAEGPGTRLRARDLQTGTVLDGTKPWCSLADHLSHALVTAWGEDGVRGLYLVDLCDQGVRRDPASPRWVARGLAEVTSAGLELEGVAATPVGGPGWYLERPGFAWGGIGVAAVWFGGAVAVARRVLEAAERREPDQVALVHLGTLDVALAAARACLVDGASVVDGPSAAGVDPGRAARLAQRVRSQVAATVEEVLRVADHALGPGPLASEEEHTRRVADLRLYVRQHHAERDLAALGGQVLGTATDPGADGGEPGWGWW